MPIPVFRLPWLHLLLLPLLLLAGWPSAVADTVDPVEITANSLQYRTFAHVRYLLDKDSRLNLEEVMAATDSQWTQADSSTPSFGFSSATLWLMMPLRNIDKREVRLVLEVAYPVLDNVELYVTQQGITEQHWETGDLLPFRQRPLDFRNFAFPLALQPDEMKTLYIRIHTSGTLEAPLQLWNADHFFSSQQQGLMAQGAYYGIMLVMILYNLFIFLSVRHVSYLFYTAAVFSCTLFNAALQGEGFQYLWPTLPAINANIVPVSIGLFGMSSMWFAITLLDMKRRALRLYYFKLFMFVGWTLLVLTALLVPYHRSIVMVSLFGAFSACVSVYTGIYMMLIGQRTARFYTLGWTCLMTAFLITTLNKWGVLPSHVLVDNAVEIGSTLEVILLSFALGDRINNERRSKQRARLLAAENEQLALAEKARYLELKHQSGLDELKAREAVIRAEAESKAKSEFLATMSHEIRTPMNGVLGMASLLQDADLEPEHRQYVDVIASSGKALLDVINDILDFSKIEAGKMELDEIDFDLDQLCLECASVFMVTAESKHIELICSLQPGTPQFINSDPTRLRQILLNLLGNAFKFTNKGRVTLRVSEQPRQSAAEPLTLRFEVSDTGIGMEPQAASNLFQAFTQADKTITRQFGGTGLGLSICKKLSELMGGHIGVTSQPGNGSQFWFTIKCRAAGPVFARENVVSLSALKGKRALIVDDSPEFVRVIQEQMAAWGMQASAAYFGEDALHQLREATAAGKPFDIVSLDMNMPGMNGLECAHQIALATDIRPCHVILLTAMRTIPRRSELQEAGVEIAIQKPASARVLRQTLIDILRGIPVSEPRADVKMQLPLQGKSVLVAEDNSVNQMVITGLLKKLGMRVEVAVDGNKVVQRYREQGSAFDLILMDCDMPELDGYAAAQQIREYEKTAQLPRKPIIALSAHVQPEHQQRVLACGMDGHILKPIELAVLKEKLIECLIFESGNGESVLKQADALRRT